MRPTHSHLFAGYHSVGIAQPAWMVLFFNTNITLLFGECAVEVGCCLVCQFYSLRCNTIHAHQIYRCLNSCSIQPTMIRNIYGYFICCFGDNADVIKNAADGSNEMDKTIFINFYSSADIKPKPKRIGACRLTLTNHSFNQATLFVHSN